jgi:hypothetical protein
VSDPEEVGPDDRGGDRSNEDEPVDHVATIARASRSASISWTPSG